MVKNRPGVPSREDLVTLNRAATVARLVSGVFHELNNHLLVIGGTTELITDAPGTPEAVAKGLARILTANARATAAILEAMRFVRQTPDVADGSVNMRDLVHHALALRAYAFGKARLTTSFEAPKEGRASVNGSAVLLEQALLNLIINAEQALAGQAGGTIRLQMQLPDGWVVLRVSDNGPGVDPAIADRLFEPFATTRARDESCGLGLCVARALTERHGGTLTVEKSDAGACFALRLPSVS
jgi:C4-dicarboxylate-specific signal transduction histidine kinase